jgi:hypothetical protein
VGFTVFRRLEPFIGFAHVLDVCGGGVKPIYCDVIGCPQMKIGGEEFPCMFEMKINKFLRD